MRTFAAVGSVGLSFVIAIALGAALGWWLDRVTGWSPFCFIFFFVCGVAAGIVNVYRAISRLPR
jgi:ATP synthase protein I